ncbi:MAG: transglutaminase domain-containing protein [Pirellulales bacterium]|nr:transglutaminase domain-containing protein [Pirellulales bacterium]
MKMFAGLVAVSCATVFGLGLAAAGIQPEQQLDTSAARLTERTPATSSHLDQDVVHTAGKAVLSDPITHEVDFVVTVTPPYGCKVLKVWLPLPPTNDGQEISASELTTFPMDVTPRIATEHVYENTFAYFEFENPQGAQVIRHKFTAKVWNQNWNVDPQRVQNVANWPSEFTPYLQPQALKAASEFDEVLGTLSGGPNLDASAMDQLLRAMTWVDSNLTYDHLNASLTADANHAFELRRGHCSDYHGLCATMGRAMGYPACVTYGLALYPKASPSHCKMDVYLPPYGWVSFDISETQKMVAAIAGNDELSGPEKEAYMQAARDRLHSGFRENSWLLLTRGTNYELAPKASKPVRLIRTIYAEADGVALPEPDPSNHEQQAFAWMTAHKYTADKEFAKPFKEIKSLKIGPTSN